MERRKVITELAPAAIGPYAQAVMVGDLLFCSGQIPIDPSTGEMVEQDIRIQTKRVLANLEALLRTEGLSARDVVKTTVFLHDMNDFTAMNEVYGDFFATDQPARSTIQVARLPKDALVEIEAIASRQ